MVKLPGGYHGINMEALAQVILYQKIADEKNDVNRNFTILNCRYLPYIRPIFQGLISGDIPPHMAKHMVLTYLHQLDPGDLPLMMSMPENMISHWFFGGSVGKYALCGIRISDLQFHAHRIHGAGILMLT